MFVVLERLNIFLCWWALVRLIQNVLHFQYKIATPLLVTQHTITSSAKSLSFDQTEDHRRRKKK